MQWDSFDANPPNHQHRRGPRISRTGMEALVARTNYLTLELGAERHTYLHHRRALREDRAAHDRFLHSSPRRAHLLCRLAGSLRVCGLAADRTSANRCIGPPALRKRASDRSSPIMKFTTLLILVLGLVAT